MSGKRRDTAVAEAERLAAAPHGGRNAFGELVGAHHRDLHAGTFARFGLPERLTQVLPAVSATG